MVIQLAKKGRPTAMLTLTVSSKNYPAPEDAARDLKRGLVALRKRIARRWPGEKMPFLAVFEKHKSGWPHLHLLIRARFIPVNWLREVWTEITGSWNVNIRKIETVGQAAYYCAKYIGKDLASFASCKRWWRSHDYQIVDPDDDWHTRKKARWSRWEAELGLVVSALRSLGAAVTYKGKEEIEWRRPLSRDVTMGDAARLVAAYWPHRQARPAGGRGA